MEQQLRIKTYTPDTSSYAPRIRNEQWEQYKPLLKYLHDEGRRRADMLQILHKQGFTPSMGQLTVKMTAWGFKVYTTQSDTPTQHLETGSPGSEDTTMATTPNANVYMSPVSGGSASTSTLTDADTIWNALSISENASLNAAITSKGLALLQSYRPSTHSADFGLKFPDNSDVLEEQGSSTILSVAGFLGSVHDFEAAFDLYYLVFEHLVTTGYSKYVLLIQMLVRCAMTATTDAQCEFIKPLLRTALDHCDNWAISELAICFGSLLQDLGDRPAMRHKTPSSLGNIRPEHLPLLLTMDPDADLVALVTHNKEWLQEQLAKCDSACSTLIHASLWCQDTFSFYRSENQTLGNFAAGVAAGYIEDMIALESEFQGLASALIIDYLNSPGPSMEKATAECREDDCIFRSALSPCATLVVMAHLLLESAVDPAQFDPHSYLESRAQSFWKAQWTTPLQELKAFRRATSVDRCDAFVHTFLKRFTTTLAFRRFTASVRCNWDRSWAAKRFANILQGSRMEMLPHAGLLSARRAVLKTIIAPFRDDGDVTDKRHSMTSESSGSMREFQHVASRADRWAAMSGSKTPSDAMSIDTRSSWSFHKVTGFSRGSLSGAASLSSRRGDHDEL